MRFPTIVASALIMGTGSVAALDAVDLSDEISSAAYADIQARLKDPSSAEFSKLWAGKRAGGDVMICGTVNAANSFGGKTGPMPFILRHWPGSSEVYLEELATDASDAPRMAYLCKNAGAPF